MSALNAILNKKESWLSKNAERLIAQESTNAALASLESSGEAPTQATSMALESAIRGAIAEETSHGDQAPHIIAGPKNHEHFVVASEVKQEFEKKLSEAQLSPEATQKYTQALDVATEVALTGIKAAQEAKLKSNPLTQIKDAIELKTSFIDPQSHAVMAAYAVEATKKTLTDSGIPDGEQRTALIRTVTQALDTTIDEVSAMGDRTYIPPELSPKAMTMVAEAITSLPAEQQSAGIEAINAGFKKVTSLVNDIQKGIQNRFR